MPKSREIFFWGDLDEITIIKSLLALPHSNADVERVFSQVFLIKTKHRNRLKTSTLDALLVTRSGLPTVLFQIQVCV